MTDASGAGGPGQPRRHALVRPGGRRVAWYEFGDPTGVPCLYTPGTPESALAGGCYDRAAREAGVRWISLDKPGYGGSDPLPGRRLRDWADDLRAVADDLGLDRVCLAGESGGGPHALAGAHALGDRVLVTVLLASMGPAETDGARDGLRLTNRVLFSLARRAPLLLRMPLALMRRASNSPRLLARTEAGEPPADRAAAADPDFALRRRAVGDALDRGTRPAAEELAMLARPWGFGVSEVATSVHLWHGDADVNVPLAYATSLARALPRATLHLVEGAGHSVGFARRDEVAGTVARAARRDPPTL